MLDQFSESFNNLIAKLQGWLDAIVLALPNIILAALVLGLSIFLSGYLKKAAKKAINKVTGNRTVVGVLANVVVSIFMLIALFVVLNIMNLSEAVTALLGTAGVIGLAVGLALQDPLINLFSGVLMSVKDYYQIGDLIETNGFFGKITQITLRSTVISMTDGQEVIIPNKEVLQNPLKNYSHNGRRRIDLTCGVAYGDNLEEVKEIALKAMNGAGFKLRDNTEVEFYFTDFGDSSINFVIRFWKDITSQADYLAAKDKAIIALKKAFDNNGITIPFPITTLDFGVVGGMRLDELYSPELMKRNKNFKNEKKEAVENEVDGGKRDAVANEGKS